MLSLTCKLAGKNLQKIIALGFFAAVTFTAGHSFAQVTPATAPDSALAPKPGVTIPKEEKKTPWYEKLAWRGYTQLRYNRLLETNSQLKSDYDRSIGDNGGFILRRARLVLSGDVHKRVYVYIQADMAVTPSGSSSIHFAQMRDMYADISLDDKKEYRFRIGQSKIPFGFENLQSSSNRLTLDRADALNSGVPNERDLGAIFYWAPEKIRKRFSEIGNSKLKGSGDYGVFALGLYNGQTTNKNEANDNLHAVARLSYPIAFKGQIIEPGIQAYTGVYNVGSDQLTSPVKGGNFDDRRAAASVVLYPQPFGFQAEYNIGEGPEFDPETKTIKVASLKGGYAQAMYSLKVKNHLLMPFVKMQYYEGGKKNELDARFSKMHETEIGVEWQPFSAFELTAQYTISDRISRDARSLNNAQNGNFLRLQAQFNY